MITKIVPLNPKGEFEMRKIGAAISGITGVKLPEIIQWAKNHEIIKLIQNDPKHQIFSECNLRFKLHMDKHNNRFMNILYYSTVDMVKTLVKDNTLTKDDINLIIDIKMTCESNLCRTRESVENNIKGTIKSMQKNINIIE